MSDPGPPALWPRRLVGAALFLAGAGALAATRAVAEGERQIHETDAAIRRQDWAEATARARSAAGWYVPGAPHVPAAYARLLHVARTTEANNDRDSALFAWRAMRASAEQTAWLVQPHQHELDLANAAIARLTSDAPRPMQAHDENDAQAARRMQALLARRDAPRGASVALVVAGLWASVLGLLLLALKGISPEGALRWERARVPAAIALGGLALYAASLWLALRRLPPGSAARGPRHVRKKPASPSAVMPIFSIQKEEHGP